MAETLVALHRSLAAIVGHGLPAVAALRGGPAQRHIRAQLIHRDFAPANLIVTTGGPRVIDFDEMGTGTTEFDIGNSLYLILFDRWLADDLAGYRRFGDRFVDAYRHAAQVELDEAAVDEGIRRRIDALARWLEEPSHAPIGIRNASATWRTTFRSFVASN